MLICTETNHYCRASRNIWKVYKLHELFVHFFLKKICHSSYFLFGKFVGMRHFLESHEIDDFQTCNRQVTVFYQTNACKRKVILLNIMALFLY